MSSVFRNLLIALCLSHYLLPAQSPPNQSSISVPNNQESDSQTKAKHLEQELQAKDLGKIVATGTSDIDTSQIKKYQSSAGKISARMLESSPSGNGDIGSILRILPNVQFDNAQNRSITPGEIDPARISISGGLHYQNSFLLDGVAMNNNLDPAGTGDWQGQAPGRSQGLAIDTSLLESITVLDSNVGAEYGGFSGGVVQANTRRPKKKFGGNISYQFTQGSANPKSPSMTRYHLYETSDISAFLNSYSDSNQPNFTKHIMRANIESKFNDRFGIISSFSSTLSYIPLRRSDDSYASSSGNSQATPIDPKDSSTAKQNQKREIYNYFIKAYYDLSERVRLELSYTYAPQYDYRFIVGTVKDFYSFDSGGHNVALKTSWENHLGSLTYTLGYQFLENSTDTNFGATKYWQASDSKAWSNWATWVRSGGYAPSESTQHTLSNKLIQDFAPISIGFSKHSFLLGAEIGYSYVDFSFSKHYDSAVKTATFMNEVQKQACLKFDINGQWCDAAKAYDTRGFESYAASLQGLGVGNANTADFALESFNGKNMLVWKNGQYFNQITRFENAKAIKLNNGVFALFLQDDIAIPLSKLGELNARLGARLDFDTYMQRANPAPRLALNYQAPWNQTQKGRTYPTQITAGANRYYAQNLYAYWLKDGINTLKTDIYRDNPDKSWESILASGKKCAPRTRVDKPYIDPLTGTQKIQYYEYDTNCISTMANSTRFQKIKTPYADELSIGLAQGIKSWNLSVKYIYREGKDEVRQIRSDYAKLPPIEGYASTYYVYTNEGKSYTNVVTLLIENARPLHTYGVAHYFMFGFDWTNVVRNYQDYTSSASTSELEDRIILWHGELIHQSQRRATNFLRPYTFRLNTTHIFYIAKTKWIWNNFFRFRSKYDADALIARAGQVPRNTSVAFNQYDPNYGNYDQYGKVPIKAAFTWDMRISAEFGIYKSHSLYMNVDIYNVLDSQIPTIATTNYTGNSFSPALAYEVGRQFWVQVGYKF